MQGRLATWLMVLALACGGDDGGGGGGGGGGGDGGVISGADADPGNPGAGEPTALAGITAAHNTARSEVGVGPITWDPQLAAVAEAWAATCTDNDGVPGLLDHNPDRGANYPGSVGENIYGSSGSVSASEAVSLWVAEEQWYDYDSNTCSAPPNQSCGHYTQVVWATSTKLGCALYDCAGLQYGRGVVCNYSAAGNSGGRPY